MAYEMSAWLRRTPAEEQGELSSEEVGLAATWRGTCRSSSTRAQKLASAGWVNMTQGVAG